jgi:hypothetical protein
LYFLDDGTRYSRDDRVSEIWRGLFHPKVLFYPRLYRAHSDSTHFHTRTQTQLEKTAIQLAALGCFKGDCIDEEVLDGHAVLIMLTDGAKCISMFSRSFGEA